MGGGEEVRDVARGEIVDNFGDGNLLRKTALK